MKAHLGQISNSASKSEGYECTKQQNKCMKDLEKFCGEEGGAEVAQLPN